jgi:hypothetical protein
MATYKDIQSRVKKKQGFEPKTCWIADVKASFGLATRQAPNRINSSRREVPCPPDKRAAIEEALRDFGMI